MEVRYLIGFEAEKIKISKIVEIMKKRKIKENRLK